MKVNKKILMSILVVGMLFSIVLPNSIKATGEGEGIATYALTDPAFPASSQSLHDAILAEYPTIDTNGDNIISQQEASMMTGQLRLQDQGITGTINGLEYFTSVDHIMLNGNSFTGEIPKELGGLTSLQSLYLRGSSLSGSIPKELGNMTSLLTLQLSSNQLTGEIPAELANLQNLQYLYLFDNQLTGEIPKELGDLNPNKMVAIVICGNNLTGEIPEELGNLTNLKVIDVSDNSLSGEIPQSIYDLEKLEEVKFNDNEELTGNPVEGFDGHSNLKDLAVSGTQLIQAKPDAANLTDDKFNYDNLADNLFNSDGSLREDVTQDEIDRALESANYWQEPTKSDWLNKIEDAQDQLEERIENEENAKNAIDDLFNPDGSIKEDLTQENIDNAQDKLDLLPNGDKKDELQDKINDAQDQLDKKIENEENAKDAVEDLFNPDGSIKDDLTQGDIDNAQDKIDLLPDGDLKEELQNNLNEAQKQLDEKNFTVLEAFEVYKGEGTVYTKIDAPVEKFSKVYVDGVELSSSNYEVTSGSTVITLKEEYLKTLVDGTYDFEIEFSSGAKVSTTLTVAIPQILQPPVDPTDPVDPTNPVNPTDPTNPSVTDPTVNKPSVSGGTTVGGSTVNTGDSTNVNVLTAMLVISLLGIVVGMKRKKVQS